MARHKFSLLGALTFFLFISSLAGVFLMDASPWQVIDSVKGPNRVRGIDFSPTQSHLAISTESNLLIRDFIVRKSVNEIQNLNMSSIKYFPNGTYLCGIDGSTSILGINLLNKVTKLLAPRTMIHMSYMDVSSDGKCALWPHMNGAVQINDFASGKGVERAPHNKAVEFACFYPQSHSFIVLQDTIQKYDVWDADATLVSEPLEYSVDHCAFSKDGKWLITQPGFEIWEAATLKLSRRCRLQDQRYTFYFNDNSRVLVGSLGEARVYDVSMDRVLHSFHAQNKKVQGAKLSPDGKYIALAYANGNIEVWSQRFSEYWWGQFYRVEVLLAVILGLAWLYLVIQWQRTKYHSKQTPQPMMITR